MSELSAALLFLTGAATGLVGALLGLGGGVFLVPLLTLGPGRAHPGRDRRQPDLGDRHGLRLRDRQPEPRAW